MSIFKVKLRASDLLWTKYLRIIYKYTCQVCGRVHLPDDCRNFGTMHYHGRGHENVRFDMDNTLPACNIPCHDYFTHHQTEFEVFMLKKLGREKFDVLALKAHMYKKRDDKADKIIIKDMLAKQELYVEV